MRLIAFETATPHGGVALLENGIVIEEVLIDEAQRHSAECLAAMEAMLCRRNLNLDNVDFFAASNGPGAFTGVRVGLTLIKALAFAVQRQCLVVNTLKVLAHQAVLAGERGVLIPTIDARMGELYAAAYSIETSGLLRRVTDDKCLPAIGFAENFPSEGRLVGFGSLAYLTEFEGWEKLPESLHAIRPSGTGLLAYQSWHAGDVVAPHAVEAIYLRHPVRERHP